jgi:type IV pilus assembly protein PilA
MAKNNNRNGFTLIEMMIIVAIIGILAAVAIGGQQAYIRRSHQAEATTILSNIRIRQEAYRGTFHRYADCADDGWNPPSGTIGANSQSWPAGNDRWRQLGAAPDGRIYYTFYSRAGVPGGGGGGDADADADADPHGCDSAVSANDFWYCARAEQDLDEDGNCQGMMIASGSPTIMYHEDVGCDFE